MNSCLRLSTFAILLLSCSLAVAEEQLPTYRSQADFVLVPVVVTDKHGNPVTGLGVADFELLDQGRKQPISSFEFVQEASTPSQSAPAPPDKVSNEVPAAIRNLRIIALDLINTPMAEQGAAVNGLVDYLANRHDGSPLELLLMHRDGVSVLQGFTRDPGKLIAAARKLVQQGHETRSIDESRALKQFLLTSVGDLAGSGRILGPIIESLRKHDFVAQATATNNTSAALEFIALSFAGAPGRKSLVWLTAGVPMTSLLPGAGGDRARFDRAMQALADANVAVYPVDVRGLQNSGIDSWNGGGAPPEQDRIAHSRIETMQTAAELTGGVALYNTNNIGESVANAMQQGSAHYLLTFRVTPGNRKPGWRELRVKVARDGARVRARAGYRYDVPDADPGKRRKKDLELALVSPLDYLSLPIVVEWRIDGGKVAYEVSVAGRAFELAKAGDALNMDFAFLATGGDGKEAASRIDSYKGRIQPNSLARLKGSGLQFRNEFTVPAGEYGVRFVVRDNATGRIGSVWMPLSTAAAAQSPSPKS